MVTLKKIAIIGAGFYGLFIGKYLSNKHHVDIFEEQNDIMTRASSQCQMRIHSGMMYPRNVKTALQCVHTFKPFMMYFKDAIVDDFKSVYAIACSSSLTTKEFEKTQNELGLSVRKIKNEFFSDIKSVYECDEYTFDLEKIKSILGNQNIIFNRHIDSFDELKDYDIIFNCAYSGIPRLLSNSNLELIPNFQTVNTEKIFYTDNLNRTAICVVDGNYFTTMCLPDTDMKTLTATDLTTGNYSSNKSKVFERVKHYIPEIEIEYEYSTFCPKSVIAESRGVYLRQDGNVYTILGGKISNVFELLTMLRNINI